MARISSTVGLVSGIDSKSIIDQLMSLEQQPVTDLQNRITTETAKKTAYTTLSTQISALALFGSTMKKPQTFRAADVTSGDEKVVTGTAATGAAAGSYQISVARLVSSQQTIGRGYASADAKVGAGTITLELGGASLDEPTELEDLNGGKGVDRGKFRVTDRSGKSTVIDVGDAMTLNDVVDKINTSLDVSVKASVKDNALVLTDQTGQATTDLSVQDIGSGTAAADLGIAGTGTGTTLAGTSLNGLVATTQLSTLNDGRGVSTAGGTTNDFSITTADGTTTNVALGTVTTIGSVVDQINAATGTKARAALDTATGRLTLTDTSTGSPGAALHVTALNDSQAAADLGLTGGASNGVITGGSIGGGVNTTLISSLRGGKGLDLGTITIKDRAGTTSNVDLGGASTVQDILDRINAADANVKADVKSGGDSIQITDLTDDAGGLTISDANGGTTAAELGLAGTFNAGAGDGVAHGANLQKAWFNRGTKLKDLNGGKGIPDGTFTITDAKGKAQTISVDSTSDTSIGDVIDEINASPVLGAKASINANGDGLLLTDTSGGTGKLTVADASGGATAKALNLVGTAAGTTIDGSYEKTIAVASTDTLTDVQTKIQNLGWGLSATIVNDGSDAAPYRLSLTSTNSGKAGGVVFDSGSVALGERTLVSAQDAALFVGGDDGSSPLLVRSASNTVTGAIRGVTLNLTGVSDSPVTVSVAKNVDNVVAAAGTFVTGFNALVTQLQTYTKFDSDTNTRGELLGDNAAQSIETEIYGMLNTVGNSSGKYRIAADVGFTLDETGQLQFDEDKFRTAFADDPDAVTTLFTRAGSALDADTQLSTLRQNGGIRSSAAGADFRVTARNGTALDVDTSDLTTVGQVLDAINGATGNNGTVIASLNAAGTGINLADKSTTGSAKFGVATLNGSAAASDLGLLGTSSGGTITGQALIDPNAGDDGGLGTIIEKRLDRLTDPDTGILTRASQEVDTENQGFTDRITSLNALLDAKRTRLETQFANLETSLSGLQNQQSALSSLK